MNYVLEHGETIIAVFSVLNIGENKGLKDYSVTDHSEIVRSLVDTFRRVCLSGDLILKLSSLTITLSLFSVDGKLTSDGRDETLSGRQHRIN